MHVTKVGLFGLGAIGRSIVSGWASLPPSLALSAVCVRPAQVDAARALVGGSVAITTSMAELLDQSPAIVIEAAGQQAARDHAVAVLERGCDFYLLSTGIFADDALRMRMIDAATRSGGTILVPAGAMAGFDGLQALREQGLDQVRYISTKPPEAWRGTPAEAARDLDQIADRVTIFEGSAREAALQFPKNANLAAAIAMAGLGLDATQVELVADPGVSGNIGRLEASGAAGRLLVEVEGDAAALNPKSSAVVGMSVLASLANRVSPLSYV